MIFGSYLIYLLTPFVAIVLGISVFGILGLLDIYLLACLNTPPPLKNFLFGVPLFVKVFCLEGDKSHRRGGRGIKATSSPQQGQSYLDKVIILSISNLVCTCVSLTVAREVRLSYLLMHLFILSFDTFSPPQWLLPHHFGGSLRCYYVRHFSLRG